MSTLIDSLCNIGMRIEGQLAELRYQLVLNYCHFDYAHDYQAQAERQDNSEYYFVLIRRLLRGHLRFMDYLLSFLNPRQNDFRFVYAQPLVCIRTIRPVVLQKQL